MVYLCSQKNSYSHCHILIDRVLYHFSGYNKKPIECKNMKPYGEMHETWCKMITCWSKRFLNPRIILSAIRCWNCQRYFCYISFIGSNTIHSNLTIFSSHIHYLMWCLVSNHCFRDPYLLKKIHIKNCLFVILILNKILKSKVKNVHLFLVNVQWML